LSTFERTFPFDIQVPVWVIYMMVIFIQVISINL